MPTTGSTAPTSTSSWTTSSRGSGRRQDCFAISVSLEPGLGLGAEPLALALGKPRRVEAVAIVQGNEMVELPARLRDRRQIAHAVEPHHRRLGRAPAQA